jgi:hypothetical protein
MGGSNTGLHHPVRPYHHVRSVAPLNRWRTTVILPISYFYLT